MVNVFKPSPSDVLDLNQRSFSNSDTGCVSLQNLLSTHFSNIPVVERDVVIERVGVFAGFINIKSGNNIKPRINQSAGQPSNPTK